jgi:protein TonB
LANGTAQFDRLSSTLFVTALAHGIVILGVTFAPLFPEEPAEKPSLNVTLLVDTEALDASSSDAEMLSSRNQAGGGEGASDRPTRALSSRQPMNQQGETLGVDTRTAEALVRNAPVDQVVSRNPSDREVHAQPETTDRPAPVPMTAAALLQQSAPDSLAAEIDLETRNAADDDSLINSPSTKESAIAAYIVGWRQRVEQIGTANFPREFLRGTSATERPIVEVTIDAEGALRDVVFLRSSGDERLDQATLTILELAGPFAPLPEAILADARVLKFNYEWYFSTGDQTAARVR